MQLTRSWVTGQLYQGHLSGNRHSELSEINVGNVAQLGAKWMFPVADGNHMEVTPVVVDGVMYLTMANQAYALDARSGRQIWHYSRPLTKGVDWRCGHGD